MANSTAGKVWVLDTAATIWTGPVYISRMDWHPNAADNDLVVNDSLAHPIWGPVRAIATAANHETSGIETWENPAPNHPIDGFVLATIDGGTLYVTTM